MKEPLYSSGQKVKILHDWAQNIPPQIIDNAVWCEAWDCTTYALIGGAIRIEEHELAPVREDSDE